MKKKTFTLRFDLSDPVQKKAYEYIEKQDCSKNTAILNAVKNAYDTEAYWERLENLLKDILINAEIKESVPEKSKIEETGDEDEYIIGALDDFGI